MLGMAWGIATVVLLLAYGTGFERGLWAAFRSFGTNLVFIFPGRTELQAGGTKAGTQIRLTVNDLDYVRTEVPLLKRVSPESVQTVHSSPTARAAPITASAASMPVTAACAKWTLPKALSSVKPTTSRTRASP